jgi:DHA1 family tetracycline resistance protein-like MFS transporter
MIYAILAVASLGGVTSPALQGLISRSVGPDEQGGVQGSLSSLSSVAGIVGTPVAAGLFAHFIRPEAPRHVPGAPFFFSALLVAGALLLVVRTFRKDLRGENQGKPRALSRCAQD